MKVGQSLKYNICRVPFKEVTQAPTFFPCTAIVALMYSALHTMDTIHSWKRLNFNSKNRTSLRTIMPSPPSGVSSCSIHLRHRRGQIVPATSSDCIRRQRSIASPTSNTMYLDHPNASTLHGYEFSLLTSLVFGVGYLSVSMYRRLLTRIGPYRYVKCTERTSLKNRNAMKAPKTASAT